LLENLKNKKIVLVPTTPLTISFAKKLDQQDIKVVGFIDKNKEGKNIYKYEDIPNIEFDVILIYNDLFFEPIYKSVLEKADKNLIYRVVQDKNYKLLNYKQIKYQLRKQKIFNFKQTVYNNLQKSLTIFVDSLRLKRKYIVILTKNHIGANTKYIYLYLKRRNYNVVLISANKDAKELDGNYLNFYSLKSYYIMALAHTIIVDEVIYEYFNNLSSKQITIQLWHGVGIKKLNPIKNISYDYFISTSNWTNTTNFQNVFNAREFLNYGYPRNDIFFRDIVDEDLNLCDKKIFELSKDNKIILYMPTYRDLLEDNIPPLDFDIFNKFLKENNIYFIVKLHPFVEDILSKKYSNVIFYPSKKDIYPILKNTDILITDYSSILYDFLLLDKPIISFVYDIEKYFDTRNGFLFDYDEYTPAKQVKTQKELIEEIINLFNGDDKYKTQRIEVRDKFFDYIDGKSCERIENIV